MFFVPTVWFFRFLINSLTGLKGAHFYYVAFAHCSACFNAFAFVFFLAMMLRAPGAFGDGVRLYSNLNRSGGLKLDQTPYTPRGRRPVCEGASFNIVHRTGGPPQRPTLPPPLPPVVSCEDEVAHDDVCSCPVDKFLTPNCYVVEVYIYIYVYIFIYILTFLYLFHKLFILIFYFFYSLVLRS